MVCIKKMAPIRAHRFECLVTRAWHYLKGLEEELGGLALLEGVSHYRWALRFQMHVALCSILSTTIII